MLLLLLTPSINLNRYPASFEVAQFDTFRKFVKLKTPDLKKQVLDYHTPSPRGDRKVTPSGRRI